MRKGLVIGALALATAAGGGTLALAGGSGLIFDDGHYVKPGSLDDGKELLPQTKISLTQAIATAQHEAEGRLGQVDLERYGSRVVYKVDVGDNEVRVDAVDGTVATVGPQS